MAAAAAPGVAIHIVPMGLLPRVSRFARRHALWRPATRVIAAVSGGSDSVALLLILRELDRRGDLVLAGAAHLNHQIRGPESDGDESFCRALALRLDVPFDAGRVDVPAVARADGVSLEVAARRARRDFLARVREMRGADAVATGHTQDDQAETVLLRLLRGSGVRGLAGIAPRAGGFIRPLLDCTRDVLRAELDARGQPWREDASNSDLANARNRVRHVLLPTLEQQFNPAARDALARLAALARDDEDALDSLAATVARESVQVDDAGVSRLDVARLRAEHPAIVRRVVQRALTRLAGPDSYGAGAVAAVLDVLGGHRRAVQLVGVRVEHSGDSVVLVPRGAAPRTSPAFRLELRIPGTVTVAEGEWVLEADGPMAPDAAAPAVAPDAVCVDAAKLGKSIVVRSRRPGDRLRPIGMAGRKKLQDVFVDRKVRRADRDRVPVVTDRQGQIVWVAGHVLAEDFKVTDGTKAVIILRLRRRDAPGDLAGHRAGGPAGRAS